MKGQLSLLDRTMLGYSGVDAAQVANAERVTIEAVHDARKRLGRRPTDGHIASPHLEQAELHAKPAARQVTGAPAVVPDAQAAWGEATLQAGLAILAALAELEAMMRANRSSTL